jgi:hypothetical protein
MKNAALVPYRWLICLVYLLPIAAFAAPPLIQNSGQIGFAGVDARDAQVYAQVAAQGENASWVIEYGTTTSYGKQSDKTDVPNGMFVGSYLYLMNLTPNTLYNYRVKATSASGAVVTGPNKTFTTIAPTAVDIDPEITGNNLAIAGSSVRLNVTVNAGSGPLTYKWKRNGVLLTNSTGSHQAPNYISGSNSDRLYIDNVTAAFASTFTCEVSNPDSPSQTTNPITVKIITLTPSDNITKKEGETLKFTVSITPPDPSATYAWEAIRVPAMTGYGDVSGATTSTLTIANSTILADDSYRCKVTIGATTVNTDTVNVELLPKPVIDPISDQTAYIGQAMTIYVNISENPTSVKVTGLPPGLSWNPTDYSIRGMPSRMTGLDEPEVIVINASNAAGAAKTVAFRLQVLPLDPDMVGAFNGLIGRGVDSKQVGGQISLNVTATGDYTGTMKLGVGTYNLKGRVVTASGGTSTEITLTNFKTGTLPAINANITIADDGTFSGSVNTTTGGDSINNGQRNPWSTFNPFPTAGLFNCQLTPGAPENADPAFPHGHSYAALTVAQAGTVSWAGRCADDSVISGSTTISVDGNVPLFCALYKGNGSIHGLPQIVAKSVSGSCSWNSTGSTSRAYRTGFSTHTLSVLGYRYVKPLAGLGEIILGLTDKASNARLSFSDGGLGSTISQVFRITSLNAIQMPTGAVLNPNTVSMTMDLTKGSITGKFSVKDPNPLKTSQILTRTATYYALIIPGTGEARGYFTLAKLPSAGPPASNTSITTSDMLSGIVVLQAAP